VSYLSKSDFLKYQTCPSYLWLWKHKKDVVPVDEEEAINRRLEQGNEVERYARKLFANAVLVETKGQQAKQETEKLVADGVKTIFQATVFTGTGLLAMADVIAFDEVTQTWTLYEVKSTNSIKPEHIYDTAFQRVAFEEAGYKIGNVGVIHLNKEYVRMGELEPSKLLVRTDITEKAEKILPTIRQQVNDALELIERADEPKGCSCRLKTKSGHCPTFHYLNPDIPEYSVFNISRIGKKSLELLVDNEVHHVHEVSDDIKLSIPQRNQVTVAKSQQPIVSKAGIDELLNELEYPLYFLDYETVSTALPLFDGCTPFQQIPFQYSLHVLKQPDGELEHYEYLSESGKEIPMPELLATMRQQIGDTGSVIVWYKVFEMGRNTEMAKAYPEYAEFLDGVNNRVFDLMEVFSKQHFVHHKFNGSSSIKAVLPVLVPEFSYKELDIQNGATASIRWYDAAVGNMTDEQAKHTFAALLKYCCLDTLAMVKIYEYLKKL
jgi:CRISPR/Cas system-associated exonuclease Cas4 (RecB family)